MHTTLQLIELAKQQLARKHGLQLPMTDYRLAKLMEIRQQTLSSWRKGKTRIGPEFATRFAEACALPEAYVFACVEMERATDPGLQRILSTIADAFKGKAAAIVALLLFGLAGAFYPANPVSAADPRVAVEAARSTNYIRLTRRAARQRRARRRIRRRRHCTVLRLRAFS